MAITKAPYLADDECGVLYTLFCSNCRLVPDALVEDLPHGELLCRECGLVLADRVEDTPPPPSPFSPPALRPIHSASLPHTRGFLLTSPADRPPIATKVTAPPLTVDIPVSAPHSTRRTSVERAAYSRKELERMATDLLLPPSVAERAKDVHLRLTEIKTVRGRSLEAVVAACLYTACRWEGTPRTLREVSQLSGASKRDIGRCYKFLLRTLGTSLDTITSEDFMGRFCDSLNLPTHVMNTSAAVAKGATDRGVVAGKSPISVAAASIFLVSQLTKDFKRGVKEISAVARVSESAIRTAYRDVAQHAKCLLPASFVPTESVDTLPRL